MTHPPDPSETRAERAELARYAVRMLDDRLAIGAEGNLSVRSGETIAITPSGVGYRGLRASDICLIDLAGTPIDQPDEPSFETPMHLAVYAATGAGAVVHTHSPEVVALSAVLDELPAIHYAIVELGGAVPVVPYARFGSAALAGAATAVLATRRAVILQNHGAVSYGRSLAQAYDRALLLEWLAGVYLRARAAGPPRMLDSAELAEVAAEFRRPHHGQVDRDEKG